MKRGEKLGSSKSLVVAAVFSFIAVAISVLAILFILLDVFGSRTLIENVLYWVDPTVNVDEELLYIYFDWGIGALLDITFARYYLKMSRVLTNNYKQLGSNIIFSAVLQILFGSFIPGIVGVIAGIIVGKKKNVTRQDVENAMGDYKFTAMTEAVNRLNELRSSGAISEEEYYSNLNKILEG